MAKVKVRTVGQTITEKLSASRSQIEAYKKALGNAVVSDMKDFIARGQSPVSDQGRFVAYKDKDKYPGNKKPSRPVNLFLSGDMLSDLKYQSKEGTSIEVGIITSSAETFAKAATHQSGLNGVPQRKFIPDGEGDEFSVKIQRTIKDVQEVFVSDLIKKLNR